MIKRFFKSAYFKATLAFVIGGTLLMLIHNLIQSAAKTNFLATINSTLAPVYIGVLIAFLLCPVYNKIVGTVYKYLMSDFSRDGITRRKGSEPRERDPEDVIKRNRHKLTVAKVIGTVISFALLIVFLVTVGYFVFPELIKSIVNLMQILPDGLNSLQKWSHAHLGRFHSLVKSIDNLADAGADDMIAWVQMHILRQPGASSDVAVQISNGVVQIVRSVTNFVFGILIAIYLLNFKDKLFALTRKLVNATCSEKKSRALYEFASVINDTFIGYIVGRIIDAIVIGCITYVTMRCIGIPMPVLVSVIVGVTNVIPFFGPILGAIPSALIILIQSPIQALYFLIMIFLIQQLDGNVIGPKIVGHAIGINSFWVLIAVLIGGGLFGFLGMFLGTPVFAVIYYYVGKFSSRKLMMKGRASKSDDYYDLKPYGIPRSDIMLEQNKSSSKDKNDKER